MIVKGKKFYSMTCIHEDRLWDLTQYVLQTEENFYDNGSNVVCKKGLPEEKLYKNGFGMRMRRHVCRDSPKVVQDLVRGKLCNCYLKILELSEEDAQQKLFDSSDFIHAKGLPKAQMPSFHEIARSMENDDDEIVRQYNVMTRMSHGIYTTVETKCITNTWQERKLGPDGNMTFPRDSEDYGLEIKTSKRYVEPIIKTRAKKRRKQEIKSEPVVEVSSEPVVEAPTLCSITVKPPEPIYDDLPEYEEEPVFDEVANGAIGNQQASIDEYEMYCNKLL